VPGRARARERERPRERLRACGAQALSDAELLAVWLRTGVRGCSALDLARRLVGELGGLRGVLEAEPGRLLAVPGLGPVRALELQALAEIGRRQVTARLRRGDAVSSPAETRRYLAARLGGYGQEVFAALFMDNRHRLIHYEELFRGTIDGASVHPREVVKRALALNAAALIVAHNHPSGVAEPSRADRAITQRLREAMALVDVRLLDHIVIGDGESVSFAERGWL
jgi:DNA repair protein RadC